MLDLAPGLEISLPAEMPVLVTDPAPLQQVFLNLLSNAVRFADPENPKVVLEFRYRDDMVEFTVGDNGPGVPSEVEGRIWRLFETVGSSSESEGTGLGLALVRKLVELQDGRVWVESEPGAGARFRFLWPMGPESSREVSYDV